MLGIVFAPLMRSSCARATVGARFAPRPARPPRAVPVAAPADHLKKSRRDTSINRPLDGVRRQPRKRRAAEPLPLGDDDPAVRIPCDLGNDPRVDLLLAV